MRVMNQLVAALGVVLLGAGCAGDGAETIAPEDEDEITDEPGAFYTALDAVTAAEMARKHKAKEGPSEGPDICYSLANDLRLKRLNMATHTVVPVNHPLLSMPNGSMASGMGHFGGALVTCKGLPTGRGILIFDLDGQSIKSVDLPCQAVSGDGDRLWVLESVATSPFNRILEFTSFADLVAGQASRELPGHGGFSLGVSARGDRLITSWHSANEVRLVDLVTGDMTPSPLEGYDGWIFGVHETEEHRYVVGSWAPDHRGVHVFDAETGASQGRMFASYHLNGLTCDVR